MIISTTASRVRSTSQLARRKPRQAPQTQNPAQERTDNPSQTVSRPEHKPRTHRPRTPPQNNRNQGRGMYHPQDDLRLIPSARTSPNQPRTEPNLTHPTVLENPRSRCCTPTPPLGQSNSVAAVRLIILDSIKIGRDGKLEYDLFTGHGVSDRGRPKDTELDECETRVR